MRKKFTGLPILALVIFVGTLFWSSAGLAQLNTGKIEGTVRDKDTGAPLAGAQVTVEGTRLGNVTNDDGYYFILNVSPGSRSVTFTYTGYQKTTVSNVLILAGQTMTVDAGLSSTVVELAGITVVGEAEPLVPRDNTVTKQRMTSEVIAQTPATTLEDLMLLEAGVQIGGVGGLERGLRIRGGRLGEEAMVVDGILLRNFTADPFRQGWGWVFEQENAGMGEDTTPLEFSTSSVEEVDIITGGFQAEYGQAQSGIINIVTKEGGPNLRGNIRVTTDQLNPRTADYGYNQLQADIGGPVPGIPNLYFHGSGEIQGVADRTPTHADEGFRGINQRFIDKLNHAVRNDPQLGIKYQPFTLEEFKKGREFYAATTGESAALWSPGNPVRQPGNWSDRTLASGKLTYSPFQGLKFLGSFNSSRYQHSYPWRDVGNYFQDGIVRREDFPYQDWAWKYGNVETIYVYQAYARRTKTANLVGGVDWNFYRSATRNASLQFRYNNFRTRGINSGDPKANYDRRTFMSWPWHDLRFEVEDYPNHDFSEATTTGENRYLPDGLTDWYRNWPYETPFKMAYGEWLYWLGYYYTREVQNNYKLDLDFQVDRYNRAKFGVQAALFDNQKYGGWAGFKRDFDNEFNYEPRMYAAYIQNRTDLSDFVIDYGLRYDRFEPRANWGFRYGDQYGQNYFPMKIEEFSPRFNVAFPVTDKSQLRFSYGAFTQIPSYSYIFSDANPGGLEYSRTDAFEAGLSYLLSDDMVLDMVTYYRDVEGNVTRGTFFRDYWLWKDERWVRTDQNGFVNRDNGNIKGMDVTVRRRFADNFSLNLMYTMQFSRTTGSTRESTENLGLFLDAATGETYTPPDELRPIDGDRTHKVSVNFNYLFPEDFRTGTVEGIVLKDLRLGAIYTLQSGAPLFDRIQWEGGTYFMSPHEDVSWLTRRAGKPVGGSFNFFRGRWVQNLDLRLTKSFRLGGARRLSFFGEVFNTFNRKLNTPYPTGSGYEWEANSHAPTGGVDWYWEERDDEERIRFNADFNGDGVLTVEEATKGEIAYKVMMGTMDKDAWGLARQIRLGLNFSF